MSSRTGTASRNPDSINCFSPKHRFKKTQISSVLVNDSINLHLIDLWQPLPLPAECESPSSSPSQFLVVCERDYRAGVDGGGESAKKCNEEERCNREYGGAFAIFKTIITQTVN